MPRREIMPSGLYDSTDRQYVHALVADGTLHVSGQVATDADGNVVGDDIETQARQAFENLGRILDEVDREFEDVAKVTSYLADIQADYEGFKSVYGEFFDDRYPCHTMIGVDALASEEFLVEIEVDVPLTD